MPELPEVETRVRELRPLCVGQRIDVAHGVWARQVLLSPATPDVAAFVAQLQGNRIDALTRRGKYLLFTLARGYFLLHLRMSGDVLVQPLAVPPPPYTRLTLTFANQTAFYFCDARKFGRMAWVAHPADALSHLGVEPLTHNFTPLWLYHQLQQHRRALKPLLLDQSVIAGLGNIYTDEALHLARLHPLQRSNNVTRLQAYALWQTIRSVLQAGIANHGASIDWVYRGGGQQQHFRVYGRGGQACATCGTPIRRLVVGQRGTHLCPTCQPEPPA